MPSDLAPDQFVHLQQNKYSGASWGLGAITLLSNAVQDRSAFLFIRCSLTTITMFLIDASVLLGSKEKLSKAFLLEPAALVLGSFEIVFIKMYVMIYVKKKPCHVNGKMREEK